jgi:hypothetical protein
MGGFRSTRWHGYEKKDLVEDCLVLSVNDLTRQDLFRQDRCAGAINWSSGGSVNFRMLLKSSESERVLELSFKSQNVGISQVITFETTQLTFGKKLWFRCPLLVDGEVCLRRIGKLYLRPGGSYFGCRRCLNLTYKSSQEHDQRLSNAESLMATFQLMQEKKL